MSNDSVMVKPVRPFEDDKKGWQEPGGPAYAVSRVRASELKANGLVEEASDSPGQDAPTEGEKAAAPVENKMAAAPANKAAK